MLKLSISNNDKYITDEIARMSKSQVKSRIYYPGFDLWLTTRFMPGLRTGERDVISVRDKKYDTLIGFCLVKKGKENKICNLSPLLDGVGLTQTLLDSALLYFNKDFTIDVPLREETFKLHQKLKQLGFEILEHGVSNDLSPQVTYIKPRNLGWI